MSARVARSTLLSRPALPSRRAVIRALIVLVIVLAGLATAYFAWFRDSSLVAVERIEVTGLDLDPGVEAELAQVASGMSTLNLDREALEAAVADEPSVVSLKTQTDFPHGLTIDVSSRAPAGWVDSDGGAVLAGDGTVLARTADRPEGIPKIEADAAEVGERAQGEALAAARVLGSAPEPLLAEVERASVDGEHGPVVEVTGGTELRFGTPASADLKWRAAAAVLADPELTSAAYIDLTAPSRPAVG